MAALRDQLINYEKMFPEEVRRRDLIATYNDVLLYIADTTNSYAVEDLEIWYTLTDTTIQPSLPHYTLPCIMPHHTTAPCNRLHHTTTNYTACPPQHCTITHDTTPPRITHHASPPPTTQHYTTPTLAVSCSRLLSIKTALMSRRRSFARVVARWYLHTKAASKPPTKPFTRQVVNFPFLLFCYLLFFFLFCYFAFLPGLFCL